MGKWSLMWADRLLRWNDHLMCERNSWSWAAKLLVAQDSAWVRLQRAQFVCAARTLLAGATGTRIIAARPRPRWDESVDVALAQLQM